MAHPVDGPPRRYGVAVAPAVARPVPAQLAGMEHTDAQSVSTLLARVRGALLAAFPRDVPVWVRGEIQAISDHRSGHCYIELVDAEATRNAETPVLKVNCWRSVWGPLKESLASQGVSLDAGMTVSLRGRVEFYAPRGQVNFILAELDVHALLGRLAQQRAALVAALDKEGLLAANRAIPVPEVPLRVGLVASPQSEGYRDFVGQLLGSDLGFGVVHAPAQVQGLAGAASVVAALRRLAGGFRARSIRIRWRGSSSLPERGRSSRAIAP